MTRLIMTWGSAQAGDRTSKTERCLQWWDSRPEWSADASGADNLRDYAPPTTSRLALKRQHSHTVKQAEQRRHQVYCASPPLKLAQAIEIRLALTIGCFLRRLRSTT